MFEKKLSVSTHQPMISGDNFNLQFDLVSQLFIRGSSGIFLVFVVSDGPEQLS